jgi:drug/metabolite transporter (DMT)-like permease
LEIKRSSLPYVALAGGIAALSFSALFVRWSTAPGIVTSCYRMGIATLILLPFFIRRVRRAGLPALKVLVIPLAAGLFTSLDHASWSTSLGMTRVANATLLNNIAPLWVALYTVVFWRERLSGRFWLGLALTLGGAAVVFGNDLLSNPHLGLGDLLALVSSLFYAAYFLVAQRGRAQMDTLTFIWLVDLTAAVALLGYSLGLGLPLSGFSSATYLTFLGAGIISQVGGYFLVAYALGHLPATLVSPTMIAQPVATALLAIPLAGEALVTGQWAGGLTVLSGIFLVNTAKRE